MRYWDFFPAEDGWGRVPMWGFAEVERSDADGVEPGTRVFGYLPPSSHLVVTPADAGEAGFVDGSPHRAALPSAYHRYLATQADPFYRPDAEEIQMLLRPLFFTSFLIDDQLDDEGLATRGPVLVHSMAVGATHWEELGAGAGELPGPQPKFFFAPDRVTKRSGDWGRAGLEARVADSWHPFCEWTGGWLETIRGKGFEAVRSAYLDVLEGRVDPKHAHVLTLSA